MASRIEHSARGGVYHHAPVEAHSHHAALILQPGGEVLADPRWILCFYSRGRWRLLGRKQQGYDPSNPVEGPRNIRCLCQIVQVSLFIIFTGISTFILYFTFLLAFPILLPVFFS
jgi:hypothetical protein